jgi:hypothetical protein
VLDGQFARGNDALGFVTDVEQYFVSVDFDNDSLDEVTVVEEFESFLDLSQEIIGAANVVDGNLFRASGRGGCHTVGAPFWVSLGSEDSDSGQGKLARLGDPLV